MAYTKQNFEDGQTLKAEHLNKMEEGIAAPDWDQMVNRPFGVESKVLYEGTDLAPLEEYGVYGFSLQLNTTLAVGDTYIVTVDGVSHEAVCRESDNMTDIHVIGNQSFIGGWDTGEPFAIVEYDGTQSVTCNVSFSSLTIEHAAVTKIDEKFLPSGTILYADSSKYLYANSDTSDTSKRLTKSELIKLVKSGRSIYVYNAAYFFVATVLLASEYALVIAIDASETSYSGLKYYTAEYTAS